jgi:hypothetical protein
MAERCFYVSKNMKVCETGKLEGLSQADLKKCLMNPRKICLYVIEQTGKIIYVGSSKNIGSTLSTGANRDYPYRWLRSRRGGAIIGHFFSFDEDFGAVSDAEVREAIEGEVVFEIRKRTGCWPEDQVEIHFRESLRTNTGVTRCVGQVLQFLEKSKLLSPTELSPDQSAVTSAG